MLEFFPEFTSLEVKPIQWLQQEWEEWCKGKAQDEELRPSTNAICEALATSFIFIILFPSSTALPI